MAEVLQASHIKEAILHNNGAPLADGDTSPKHSVTAKLAKQAILGDLRTAMAQLDALRKGSGEQMPIDLSFAEYVQERWGYAATDVQLPNGETMQVPESFLLSLGVNPSTFTVEKLYSLGEIDEGYRWIVPELFREAIRLGLRKSPIYPNLIRQEETVSQTTVKMPDIKMSDMTPRKLGEMETIATGTVAFGSKEVTIKKIGLGIKMSDEVVRYSTLNLLGIALEDMGVLLGMGLDTMAINTLINGDQLDGSDSCGVIGTANGTSFAYRDILKTWIRMQRIGQLPSAIISNEDPALDVLLLPEFKGFEGQTTTQKINLKTPVPTSQDFYIHGAMPDADYLLFVNAMSAMLKLNAVPLRIESERVVSRQLEAVYATLTTGFATLKRDARLIMDKGQTFTAFPSWFNVDLSELVTIQ